MQRARPRALADAPARRARRLRRAFVGRDTELELLQATYRRAVEQGEPHLVTIMGDAGVGQDAPRARALATGSRPGAAAAAAHRPLPRLRPRITYWALGEILQEHLGILESDPPESVRARLGDREILGLALGLDVAGDLHPLAARDRLHEALGRAARGARGRAAGRRARRGPALGGGAAARPARARSLDERARPAARDRHGAARAARRRPAWGGGRRNASLVWLEALLAERRRQRCSTSCSPSELPPGRCASCSSSGRRAIRSSSRSCSDAAVGVLERRGGWARRGRRLGRTPCRRSWPPASTCSPPAEKGALQAAAVIGRIFWSGPVLELVEGAAPDFDAARGRDFVRRRPARRSRASASTRSSTRSRARSLREPARRRGARGCTPRSPPGSSGRRRAGRGRAAARAPLRARRPTPTTPTSPGRRRRASSTSSGARPSRWLRRAADLAIGRYDLDEALADPRRGRSSSRAGRAGRDLAGDRPRERAQVRGRAFWDAMKRAIELTDDPGERAELLGARLPDGRAVGHVALAARGTRRSKHGSTSARACRAGQPGAGAGPDRARILESV